MTGTARAVPGALHHRAREDPHRPPPRHPRAHRSHRLRHRPRRRRTSIRVRAWWGTAHLPRHRV